MLPKSEFRALGCVDEDGNIEDRPVQVRQTDRGTWEVSLIDPDDYPRARN